MQGDPTFRCGNCGEPTRTQDASEPHWVRATWTEQGYYSCEGPLSRKLNTPPINEDR